MADPTPTQVLLTTTFRPVVMALSGALAHGAQLIDRFLEHAPSPAKTARFARDLRALLREGGRRIMAWVLNHLEPEREEETPSLLRFEDRLSRRRPRSRRSIATLFGGVELWRRLDEPVGGGGRSVHPLAMRLGIEAGLAPPALAERVGRGATDQTQRQVLTLLEEEHGGRWSCTALRKLRWAVRAWYGAASPSSAGRAGRDVVGAGARFARSFSPHVIGCDRAIPKGGFSGSDRNRHERWPSCPSRWG